MHPCIPGAQPILQSAVHNHFINLWECVWLDNAITNQSYLSLPLRNGMGPLVLSPWYYVKPIIMQMATHAHTLCQGQCMKGIEIQWIEWTMGCLSLVIIRDDAIYNFLVHQVGPHKLVRKLNESPEVQLFRCNDTDLHLSQPQLRVLSMWSLKAVVCIMLYHDTFQPFMTVQRQSKM